MCFKRKKRDTNFNQSVWTERLSELKSSLEFKTRSLEFESDNETEIANIKKEALSVAKICLERLELSLTAISEILPPRDKRRCKEFSAKINDAVYETIDSYSNITTPYDYKARLLPTIERLHAIISECTAV